MGTVTSSTSTEHRVTDSYNTTTTTIDNSDVSGMRGVEIGNVSGSICFGDCGPARRTTARPPRRPSPARPARPTTITVANASANAVKLYYSSATMSTSSLIRGNTLLTPSNVGCIDIQPSEHLSFPIEQDIYVTVFSVTGYMYSANGRPMLENYLVEKRSAKSCIITDVGVRFARDGEIWIDESGANHKN